MPDDPHAIPLADAIVLTARWRQHMPAGAIKGASFERVAFDTLLNQSGCAGIRIYLGMKGDLSWTYVMVGIDANGKDLVGAASGAAPADDGGAVEEQSVGCPPYCDTDSPLNGSVPRR